MKRFMKKTGVKKSLQSYMMEKKNISTENCCHRNVCSYDGSFFHIVRWAYKRRTEVLPYRYPSDWSFVSKSSLV